MHPLPGCFSSSAQHPSQTSAFAVAGEAPGHAGLGNGVKQQPQQSTAGYLASPRVFQATTAPMHAPACVPACPAGMTLAAKRHHFHSLLQRRLSRHRRETAASKRRAQAYGRMVRTQTRQVKPATTATSLTTKLCWPLDCIAKFTCDWLGRASPAAPRLAGGPCPLPTPCCAGYCCKYLLSTSGFALVWYFLRLPGSSAEAGAAASPGPEAVVPPAPPTDVPALLPPALALLTPLLPAEQAPGLLPLPLPAVAPAAEAAAALPVAEVLLPCPLAPELTPVAALLTPAGAELLAAAVHHGPCCCCASSGHSTWLWSLSVTASGAYPITTKALKPAPSSSEHSTMAASNASADCHAMIDVGLGKCVGGCRGLDSGS